MSNGKIRVAVFFGGRSPEHDVSIVTGLQVIQALDAARYEPVPVYVDRCGVWRTGEKLLDRSTYIPARDADGLPAVSLEIAPGKGGMLVEQTSRLFGKPRRIPFDVAIPAFHGPYGEDGDMQGLFEAAGIPYTGMRVLASAIFMDKAATKQALAGTGIPTLPCAVLRKPVGGLLPPRADIEAARRLYCDEQLRIFIQLARDNRLLLVSAGHAARGRNRALTAANIKLLDELLRILTHTVLANESVFLESGFPIALQHEILLQRIIQHEAELLPVFRNMTHAELAALADGHVNRLDLAERTHGLLKPFASDEHDRLSH